MSTFSTAFVGSSILALLAATAAKAGDVTVCAIRWDAWYTNGNSDPAHFTANALSAPQWHQNAPLHAKFDAGGHITWAPSQETFDHEIRVAHKANLCWAYLMYGGQDNVIDLHHPMMQGLAFHRSSKLRGDVKTAMMITTQVIGRSGHYEAAAAAILELLRDDNYQRVNVANASRPLIFLFFDPADLTRLYGGSLAEMKSSIDLIRERSVQARLGNPYIVVVLSPAKQAEAVRAGLGADAISEYVSGTRTGHPEAWKEFEPTIENDWTVYMQTTTGDAIPNLRTGADIRARCEKPPPFEHRFAPGAPCNNYTTNPTLTELRDEFAHARTWVENPGHKDPARLILVYAWSECDESGNCLMPTVGDPSGRKIDVIAAAMR
jgi:hypothetical protein